MYYRTAESDEDYQHVRRLRNAVKQYMTNTREHITEEQQKQFKNRNHTLYMYFSDFGSFIGYSLILKTDGRFFGSLAVEQEFRGKGYGVEIYKHMQTICQDTHNDLWLDIYCDNNRSIIAALKAGFLFDTFRDGIMTFVYRKNKEGIKKE